MWTNCTPSDDFKTILNWLTDKLSCATAKYNSVAWVNYPNVLSWRHSKCYGKCHWREMWLVTNEIVQVKNIWIKDGDAMRKSVNIIIKLEKKKNFWPDFLDFKFLNEERRGGPKWKSYLHIKMIGFEMCYIYFMIFRS